MCLFVHAYIVSKKTKSGKIFIRGRSADNTDKKSRGYTNQEGTNGLGSAAIQRAHGKAIQITKVQRGEERQQ